MINECRLLWLDHHYVIKFVSELWQVGGFLRLIRFPAPKKAYCHYIDEILLKVALNTITLSSLDKMYPQEIKYIPQKCMNFRIYAKIVLWNHRLATIHWQTLSHNDVLTPWHEHLTWAGFELNVSGVLKATCKKYDKTKYDSCSMTWWYNVVSSTSHLSGIRT
jgi:hypothetical protein